MTNKISNEQFYLFNGNDLVESSKIDWVAHRVAYTIEEYEFKGGMIVCSTDVNSNSGNSMLSKAKSWMKTLCNRWFKNSKTDKAIKEIVVRQGVDIGYSIGNLFRGRYYDKKNNKLFCEKSFSIEIRGIPMDIVKQVAEQLCKSFNQQSVLVVDYETNKSLLLYA